MDGEPEVAMTYATNRMILGYVAADPDYDQT